MNPNEEQQDRMVKRLARIEGQLRGVQKLIRDGQDCEKILQQLTASRKALDKAFFEMMACMVESCLIDSKPGTDPAQQAEEVRALLSRYA